MLSSGHNSANRTSGDVVPNLRPRLAFRSLRQQPFVPAVPAVPVVPAVVPVPVELLVPAVRFAVEPVPHGVRLAPRIER
jgi:hypothetical protein